MVSDEEVWHSFASCSYNMDDDAYSVIASTVSEKPWTTRRIHILVVSSRRGVCIKRWFGLLRVRTVLLILFGTLILPKLLTHASRNFFASFLSTPTPFPSRARPSVTVAKKTMWRTALLVRRSFTSSSAAAAAAAAAAVSQVRERERATCDATKQQT